MLHYVQVLYKTSAVAENAFMRQQWKGTWDAQYLFIPTDTNNQ